MPEPSGPRRPRLALLMGDVAGVGPEVVARTLETHHQTANLLVVGQPVVVTRSLDLVRYRGDCRFWTLCDAAFDEREEIFNPQKNGFLKQAPLL